MARFHRRSSIRRIAAVGAVVLLAAGLGQFRLTEQVGAAEPGAGAVGPGSRTADWQGQRYAAAATADPAACPSGAEDPQDVVCDHFTLRVPVDESYWSSRDGGAEVTISWPDPADDFDLYVYQGGELVASSASGGTTKETVLLSEATGRYEVRVLPFLVTDSAYEGTATFQARPSDGAPPLGGPAEYHGTVFADTPCPTAKLPCLPDREPRNTRIDSPFPSLVLKSGPVGRESAEPTIGVDGKGRAFYAAATFDGPGGLANTRLLRSTNDGNSWQDVTAEPAPGQDFPVTLDPYVYVEEDTGRVFDLDLYVGSAFLSFSDDGGRTYETNPAASGDFVNDHQTLFAGPLTRQAKELGLRTLDPDFPEALYYCFNRVADSSCGRSLDGGRTFQRSGSVAYPGVEPMEGGAFCGGLHGHVGTDRSGRVLLPKGHCGRPYISISNDAGLTWERGRVSDRIDMPDNQSSVSADAAGNLYYVWYDSKHRLPWLTISRNHGRTWGDPIMIAPPGVREVQWPTVAAGADGRIAISFPGTTERNQGDLTRPWDYYVVASVNALTVNPTFVSNIANPATDPVHRGDCPGRCGNMLDFLDVIVSPADGVPATPTTPRVQGHSIWATVVDTCTARLSCRSNPDAEGFSDAGDGAAVDMRGLYVKQVGGPNVGW
ncbi:MAG: hypothetical protein M3419_00185 [Actinomycetota bacterium]|nr:hypothetical protein [Actinomycetota bacterium]